jgi:UDP-N-acetylglucosamine--N-acetylmuramyl-(pentapeptide) pyrophosphoryl-undecaprenol N-acetylglucosamine transferase
MRIVIAAGGTGGHINPGISVAEAVQKKWPESEILFICSKREIEERIYTRKGLPFKQINARGMQRGLLSKLLFPVTLFASVFESFTIITRFRPQVVLGMGGYVGVPPMIAARLLGIPTALHEQNSIPGKANRLAARFASAVMTGFRQASSCFRGRDPFFTGNPIRTGLLDATRADALRVFGFREGVFTLLVVGGSQGAAGINRLAVGALGILKGKGFDVQVIHMAGKARDEVAAGYAARKIEARCETYFEDIGLAYVIADLVVSRAGAIALAEITAFAKPAILIPYPYSADGHQKRNAQCLAEQGAVSVLDEDAATDQTLASEIERFYTDVVLRKRTGERSGQFAVKDAQEKMIGVLQTLLQKVSHTHAGRH